MNNGPGADLFETQKDFGHITLGGLELDEIQSQHAILLFEIE
jgi:hypothetical protein